MNVDSLSRGPVSILAMAYNVPPKTRNVRDIFLEEGATGDGVGGEEIGIDQVHVYEEEWRSDLALAAAKECLRQADLKATDLGMIVDFSVMPQDYVVPSWCMSNRIQHELGAKNAFNLGFGGGGTSNFLVAMKFAASMLKTEEDLDNALLISTDVSIAGNRVINREDPVTVLGDGASAVVLSKRPGICEILGTDLRSNGSRNDVFHIPGGGLAFPDRVDLYRLQLRREKYSPSSAFHSLKDLCNKVSRDAGVDVSEIASFVGPNISAQDQMQLAETFEHPERDPFAWNRQQHGHIQGTDFVVNLSHLLGRREAPSGNLGLICSHGWGFLSGATLIRY